jgi:hypothetical protein
LLSIALASICILLYGSIGTAFFLSKGGSDDDSGEPAAVPAAIQNILVVLGLLTFVFGYFCGVIYFLLWLNLIQLLMIKKRNRASTRGDNLDSCASENPPGNGTAANSQPGEKKVMQFSDRISTTVSKKFQNSSVRNLAEMDAFAVRRHSSRFKAVLMWTLAVCVVTDVILTIAVPESSLPVLVVLTALKVVPILLSVTFMVVGGLAKLRKYNKVSAYVQFVSVVVACIALSGEQLFFLWACKNGNDLDCNRRAFLVNFVVFTIMQFLLAFLTYKILKMSVKKAKKKALKLSMKGTPERWEYESDAAHVDALAEYKQGKSMAASTDKEKKSVCSLKTAQVKSAIDKTARVSPQSMFRPLGTGPGGPEPSVANSGEHKKEDGTIQIIEVNCSTPPVSHKYDCEDASTKE